MIKLFGHHFNFWKYLVNFWTIFFMVLIVFDFIFDNALLEILELTAFIYIGVLAIYAGNKEFERWYNRHKDKHPGEVFVIIWTSIIFLVVMLDLIWPRSYHLPSAVISAYVAVLTILAVTEKSKSLHRKRR
jgi:hypothetical protein